MKPVVFSHHARQQMLERGTSEAEVREAIATGERIPARRGRLAYRRNFQYGRVWGTQRYAVKQVMPIVAEEPTQWVVITVYAFYF